MATISALRPDSGEILRSPSPLLCSRGGRIRLLAARLLRAVGFSFSVAGVLLSGAFALAGDVNAEENAPSEGSVPASVIQTESPATTTTAAPAVDSKALKKAEKKKSRQDEQAERRTQRGSSEKKTNKVKRSQRTASQGPVVDPSRQKSHSANAKAAVNDLDFSDLPIENAFIFVGSQYIRAPYVISSRSGQLFVNDVLVEAIIPDHGADSDPESGSEVVDAELHTGTDGSHRRRHQRPQPPAELLHDIATAPRPVLVALPDQPLVIMAQSNAGYTLLAEMTDFNGSDEKRDSIDTMLPAGLDRDVWEKWRRDVVVTPELTARAHEALRLIDEVVAENRAVIRAERRLNQFTYPLTIFGMILSVLAIGHLMSWRPPTKIARDAIDSSPEMLRMVSRSLQIVVALSALDLVWTLLATQANSMREVNPLANLLVHDPAALIGFKILATTLGVGLMIALRHYQRAQLASWWACLILTLLTVRWLTFSSLLA